MEGTRYQGIVYCADLNNQGRVDYPRSEVLQINAGDTIVFRLPPASPISNRAHMRINLPDTKADKLSYHSSQSLPTLKKTPSAVKLNAIADIKLASLEPVKTPLGGLEFPVLFKYPGSFFYQIEYFDEHVNSSSKATGR
jgi:hypothetical protein